MAVVIVVIMAILLRNMEYRLYYIFLKRKFIIILPACLITVTISLFPVDDIWYSYKCRDITLHAVCCALFHVRFSKHLRKTLSCEYRGNEIYGLYGNFRMYLQLQSWNTFNKLINLDCMPFISTCMDSYCLGVSMLKFDSDDVKKVNGKVLND